MDMRKASHDRHAIGKQNMWDARRGTTKATKGTMKGETNYFAAAAATLQLQLQPRRGFCFPSFACHGSFW